MLRRALWAAGLRYRLNWFPSLPGKPDIVFPGPKVGVFVDGCFWHGCPIHGHIPKSRENYWNPKLERNIQRDANATTQLSERGWRVLRFWEHQIKNELAQCAAEVSLTVRFGKTPPTR